MVVEVGAAGDDGWTATAMSPAVGRPKRLWAVFGVGAGVGEFGSEGACVIISANEANLRLKSTVPIESFLGDTEVISRTLRAGEVGVEGSGLPEYAIISLAAGEPWVLGWRRCAKALPLLGPLAARLPCRGAVLLSCSGLSARAFGRPLNAVDVGPATLGAD